MWLIEAPILRYPDFNKPFIIQLDASYSTIGSVLSQLDKNKIEHPVAYTSKTLNKHERNYIVTELKCLAVLYTIKQF